MTDAAEQLRDASTQSPLHDLAAERSLLSSILANVAASEDALWHALDRQLRSVDFYCAAHGKLFEAMLTVADAGHPVGRAAVDEALGQLSLPAELSLPTLKQLLNDLGPPAADPRECAQAIYEKSLARRLVSIAESIAQGQGVALAEAQLSALLVKIDEVEHAERERPAPALAWIKDAFKEIEYRYEGQAELGCDIPTGFLELDKLTSGLQRGDVTLVGAAPLTGKTTFGLNVATRTVLEHRRASTDPVSVLFFTLGLSTLHASWRVLSSEARINIDHLRSGRLVESDWPRLAHAAGKLMEARGTLYFDSSPSLTINELCAKSRRLETETDKAGNRLGLIVVDGLQSLSAEPREGQLLDDIVLSLKQLARELNVAVLALSEIEQAEGKRTDWRPTLSELYNAGGRRADAVMSLFREEVRKTGKEAARGVLEIHVARQAIGASGTISVAFIQECMRVNSFHREEDAV